MTREERLSVSLVEPETNQTNPFTWVAHDASDSGVFLMLIKKRRRKVLRFGAVGALAIIALISGCTTQGGVGRMLGLKASLGIGATVGDNASFQTTTRDHTLAGQNITKRNPYPSAATPARQKSESAKEAWNTKF